jgi:uncharacterized protein
MSRLPPPTSRIELLALLDREPRLGKVRDSLLQRAPEHDAAHDLAHLHRVALWAARILNQPEKTEAVIAAALLHDLVNVPKNHPDRARASEFSADEARPLLEAAGFTAPEVEEIALAIRQHSFSRGEKPASALGMALQDADRLEALGSIGIMRVYSTGVKMGARYFHEIDPWAKHREMDDSLFSLDHFFTKLLKLPDTMNTASGRSEALQRVKPMQAFLESLERELGESRS